MSGPEFDWDPVKAAANLRKHRVSFEEAASVWFDPNRIESPDHASSELEDREITIGLSNRLRLLTICFGRRNETKIRLTSARSANQAETRRYTGQG